MILEKLFIIISNLCGLSVSYENSLHAASNFSKLTLKPRR